MGWKDAPLTKKTSSGSWRDAPISVAAPPPALITPAPPIAGGGSDGSDLQYYQENYPTPPAQVSLSSNASIPLSSVPGMALDNLVPSAVQLAKDTIQPIIKPIETAQSIGSLALGVLRKSGADVGDPNDVKAADAVGKFLEKRYVGAKNFKRTLAKDPAGVLADLSMIFSLGGTGMARVPGVVGKTGEMVKSIGQYTDPLSLTAKTIGSVVGPTIKGPVKRLMDQGITPTAGQILGGGFKKTEDAVMSVPFLGSVISGARQRANNQFNKAAYNRALNPIGENAKNLEVGDTGISDISDKLSNAYNEILPKVSLPVDDRLIENIINAVENAKSTMDTASSSTLQRIVDNKIVNRLLNGELSGTDLKILQEDIRLVSDKFRQGSASERMGAEALDAVQSALRKSLARANPNFANELNAIDKGYANYVRLRNVGSKPNADIDAFTPAQLQQAVKASDKSLGKGDTARGRALMQDLSMDARKVMGDKLPTSGTIERGILASMLLGGYYLDPSIAAMVGGASLPYLPGAQRGVANALTSRPKSVRTMGQALSQYGPTIARASFQSGRANEEMNKALGAR